MVGPLNALGLDITSPLVNLQSCWVWMNVDSQPLLSRIVCKTGGSSTGCLKANESKDWSTYYEQRSSNEVRHSSQYPSRWPG